MGEKTYRLSLLSRKKQRFLVIAQDDESQLDATCHNKKMKIKSILTIDV